jgi:hypothetical protein
MFRVGTGWDDEVWDIIISGDSPINVGMLLKESVQKSILKWEELLRYKQ